jgi:PleD family two-component response regulator
MQKIIFIVDDNATNLTVAENALAKQYRVIALSSAAKMFSALEKFKPDLILLDIEMPLY